MICKVCSQQVNKKGSYGRVCKDCYNLSRRSDSHLIDPLTHRICKGCSSKLRESRRRFCHTCKPYLGYEGTSMFSGSITQYAGGYVSL